MSKHHHRATETSSADTASDAHEDRLETSASAVEDFKFGAETAAVFDDMVDGRCRSMARYSA